MRLTRLEARSMLAGAAALAAFSQVTSCLLMKRHWPAAAASLAALPVWLALAFGLWAAFLR